MDPVAVDVVVFGICILLAIYSVMRSAQKDAQAFRAEGLRVVGITRIVDRCSALATVAVTSVSMTMYLNPGTYPWLDAGLVEVAANVMLGAFVIESVATGIVRRRYRLARED